MQDERPKTEGTITALVTPGEVSGVGEDEKVGETVVPMVAPSKVQGVWQSFLMKVAAFRGFVRCLDRTTKSFIVVFVVFALLVALFNIFKGQFIAATVNGSSISRWSVVQELERQFGKNTLDGMITKQLIADEAKRRKVIVAKADIDAEIKKVSDQVATQGGTLEEALAAQGMTLADFREQILLKKELEKILADKIAVSDEEVNQYLNANKQLATSGASADDVRTQVREQLKGQKFGAEAGSFVKDLKDRATIDYSSLYQ